jgi:AraC-like DNA-binding protein
MNARLQLLKEVRFANPRLARVGVEIIDLAELRHRVAQHHFATPERAEFFMLLLVTGGSFRHTVDFVDLRLGPGSLVYVHAGQVQQWHFDSRAQGYLVMVDPPALPDLVDRRKSRVTVLTEMEEWPACVRLDDAFARDIKHDFHRLARDIKAFDESEHDVALIRNVLLGVMLRVGRWHRARSANASHQQAAARDTYRLFRRELEQRFREHWSIDQYSRRLGFSKSTLGRACRTATGRSARDLVHQRVSLEACRMLAHSQSSVAEIGHWLGFSEPTNFIRFFANAIGVTPARFRRYGTTGTLLEPAS